LLVEDVISGIAIVEDIVSGIAIVEDVVSVIAIALFLPPSFSSCSSRT
jgi:hypothetical protein